MNRTITIIAAALICAGSATAQKPAPPPPDPLATAAADAADKGALGQFQAKVEYELEPILLAPKPADTDRIIRLAALRRFAQYFRRIDTLDGDQIATLKWLVSQPDLLDALALTVSRFDAPDRVLAILQALHVDQKDLPEQFPDLTTALCVVWDMPSKQSHGLVQATDDPSINPRRPVALFQFYTKMRSQLRFDPKLLPVELATYVVDNLCDQDEMAWALDRYRSRGKIGSAFFDVPYDIDAFSGNSELRLADKPYKLPNIMLAGGICGDQAYFAAQVARSIGVPATICTGQGAFEGTGHAWVGYLGALGNRAAWDFEEGRYPENQYWKGDVIDPQTREHITDAEVSLLAELPGTRARDRLFSTALVRSADLVDETHQALLYAQAIELSPGNRLAWRALAELGAQLKLTDKQAAGFNAAVSRFAAKRYPDFALEILEKSISGRGTNQQISALDDLRGMFSDRPDLQAAIRALQGDLYRRDKRSNEALVAYVDALQRTSIGPIVVEIMDHVDSLLRDEKALSRLASVYQYVWQRMPQPTASIAVQSTPYYRIGQRYADLLDEMGQTNAAQNVKSRLESLTTTVTVMHKGEPR